MANLPEYVDENYLEGMVRPYGNVVSVRILRDNSKYKRNFSVSGPLYISSILLAENFY